MKTVLLSLLFAAAGFTAYSMVRDGKQDSREVMLALYPDEVRDLCSRTGYSIEDFFERAHTIGVAAAMVSAQPLDVWLDRGDVLYFSRADAEKWNLAGLTTPSSPLRANSLWTRDPVTFSHLLETVKLRRIAVSTQAYNGALVLSLDPDFDLQNFPASFDFQLIRFMRQLGLIPILHATQFDDVSFAFGATADPKLPAIAYAETPPPDGADLSGAWLAYPERRVLKVKTSEMPRGVLLMADIDLARGPSEAWRAIWGRGSRLLIAHLAMDRGIEENLSLLRVLAGDLRRGGVLTDGLPDRVNFAKSKLETWGRYLLAAFAAIFAPLLAMRQGLHLLRRASSYSRYVHHNPHSGGFSAMKSLWMQASPAPEIASAVAGIIVTALALALFTRSLLEFSEWKLGLFRMPWLLWTTLCPMAISGASLYAADMKFWRRGLKRSLTYMGVLKAVAIAAGITVFFFPRYLFASAGLLPFVERISSALMWWFPIRWREIFVGIPCLIIGITLHYRYLREIASSNERRLELASRPWLLLGLLGPIGIIHTFGLARAPYWVLIPSTMGCIGLGILVSAAWYAASIPLRSNH